MMLLLLLQLLALHNVLSVTFPVLASSLCCRALTGGSE